MSMMQNVGRAQGFVLGQIQRRRKPKQPAALGPVNPGEEEERQIIAQRLGPPKPVGPAPVGPSAAPSFDRAAAMKSLAEREESLLPLRLALKQQEGTYLSGTETRGNRQGAQRSMRDLRIQLREAEKSGTLPLRTAIARTAPKRSAEQVAGSRAQLAGQYKQVRGAGIAGAEEELAMARALSEESVWKDYNASIRNQFTSEVGDAELLDQRNPYFRDQAAAIRGGDEQYDALTGRDTTSRYNDPRARRGMEDAARAEEEALAALMFARGRPETLEFAPYEPTAPSEESLAPARRLVEADTLARTENDRLTVQSRAVQDALAAEEMDRIGASRAGFRATPGFDAVPDQTGPQLPPGVNAPRTAAEAERAAAEAQRLAAANETLAGVQSQQTGGADMQAVTQLVESFASVHGATVGSGREVAEVDRMIDALNTIESLPPEARAMAAQEAMKNLSEAGLVGRSPSEYGGGTMLGKGVRRLYDETTSRVPIGTPLLSAAGVGPQIGMNSRESEIATARKNAEINRVMVNLRRMAARKPV